VSESTGIGQASELTVQGQTLQQLYTDFVSGVFLANRRYQRKLVWAVEEKENLIDSVVHSLPIPLVLVAEVPDEGSRRLEIIDGLQRLNAIFSFLENEFAYDGKYFSLDALADTKFALDSGRLTQKEPVLDRETCRHIANYLLPISTYRSPSEESVDEVFRRINSSGRKLSLQEIRQAGNTSDLAALVRRISAAVRGDASLGDTVALEDMPKISITNRDLGYGIKSEDIFWVREGVLPKEAVRESRDEELVLDMILDIVLENRAPTASEYRDSAYGRETNRATSEDVVSSAIRRLGPEQILSNFVTAIDLIRQISNASGKTWAQHTAAPATTRGLPRYFHSFFIALYDLLFNEDLVPRSIGELNEVVENLWAQGFTISRGGTWGVRKKTTSIESIKAALRSSFKPEDDELSRRRRDTATQFELELQMALTESALFEFKQGFTTLQGPERHAFNEGAFHKVLRTASAMANEGPSARGFIIFGVADDSADADAVALSYGVRPVQQGSFFITGTQHELAELGTNVDEMSRKLVSSIKSSKLDDAFAKRLAATLTPFRYRDCLLWSLRPEAGRDVVNYDGRIYYRSASSTEEATGAMVMTVVRRF